MSRASGRRARDEGRAGEKVHRSDARRLGHRRRGIGEPAQAHPDAKVRVELGGEVREDLAHAGLPVGEQLAQLAGHGDRVLLGAGDECDGLDKGGVELLHAPPQRAGDLPAPR